MDTPCVVVDLRIVENNIRGMIAGLRAQGIAHRPHFKAHKSLFLARRQISLGAVGMTCATVGEAEVLAAGGIGDILIAYPVIGAEKIARMMRVEARAGTRVASVINSLEGAAALSSAYAAAGLCARVLIEIEGGMGRSPITPDTVADFARAVKDLPGLRIDGVMTYRGGIYGAANDAERLAAARREVDDLTAARKALRGVGIAAEVLSGGSSFSGKIPGALVGITEVRAGNYIFNDVAQLSVGMVSEDDCALTVAATVVTMVSPRQAVVDAGSKTLTGDTARFGKGYGRLAGYPGAEIRGLSEEHGYVDLPEGARLGVGDIVRIIPNHACVVPNLAERLLIRDGDARYFIPVDARGRNA